MKEMECSKKITYRWWYEEEIKEEHIEPLDESAEARIAEMLSEGYTSGELFDNIRMSEDDPKDGIEYRGWWEVTDCEKTYK